MKTPLLALAFLSATLPLVGDISPREAALMTSTNAQLNREMASLGKHPFLDIGDALPAFALVDQQGNLCESRSFLGRTVVVNFIFTRCTVPSMCPAATQRMAALQKATKAAGIEGVHFLTITFDPAFDTPEVLAAYAERHGLDTATFTLLTGDKPTIENLMKLLGVLSYDDAELIYKHTMQTTLIAPSGRVAYRVPGSFWTAEDFLAQIRKIQPAIQEQPAE